MDGDIQNLRTALIITLSILVVLVAWRRFKRKVVANDMPAPSHAELLALEVEYHPARLRVVLSVPKDETIHTSLLDAHHEPLHTWADMRMERGETAVQLALPVAADGLYHLEMRTATQRTVRQFRLKQA